MSNLSLWLRVIPLAAVLACAHAQDPGPTPVATAPAQPAPKPVPEEPSPTPLGPARTARVHAAYANVKIAVQEWRFENYGSDCLLLFAENEEWLWGCPTLDGADGFVSTGEKPDGKDVLWNPKSLMTSGKYMPYEQVKLALVGTVGSSQSDKGSKTPVLVVQEWDALHKNHPGFQQSNIEEWLGVFVHEAFHARQMWHPKVQSIIERWTTAKPPVSPDDLAGFYKNNEAFRAAITQEFELLKAATDKPKISAADAKKVLTQWLKLYKSREKTFAPTLEATFPGKDAWFMDGFETFLEGSARYVEARFLIAPDTAAVEGLKNEPTFKAFAGSRGKKP